MNPTQRARAGGLVAVIALIVAVAGCYSSASSTTFVIDSGSISWSAPSAWRMTVTPPLWNGGVVGITFVSPDAIAFRCPSGQLPTLESCWPIAKLPQNGVLVGSIPLRALTPQPTSSAWATIAADGGTFPALREAPGPCGAIGADETLSAIAPAATNQSGDEEMLACVRGPDLASGEATVKTILASVRPRGSS